MALPAAFSSPWPPARVRCKKRTSVSRSVRALSSPWRFVVGVSIPAPVKLGQSGFCAVRDLAAAAAPALLPTRRASKSLSILQPVLHIGAVARLADPVFEGFFRFACADGAARIERRFSTWIRRRLRSVSGCPSYDYADCPCLTPLSPGGQGCCAITPRSEPGTLFTALPGRALPPRRRGWAAPAPLLEPWRLWPWPEPWRPWVAGR